MSAKLKTVHHHYMKIFTISLFITLATTLISMRFVSQDHVEISKVRETELSPLAVYGEMVFKQEDCLKCHTLHVNQGRSSKVSLDGYGGMRSIYWFYAMLNDPKALMYATKMPSFAHLDDKQLSKSIIPTLFDVSKPEEIDSIWNLMLVESEEISNDLNAYQMDINKHHVYHKHTTEMIALIAFLNQIPASAERKRLDSLSNVKLQIEMAVWEERYKNSDSLILQLSKKKSSIQDGKILFEGNCVVCHGQKGQGNIGPNLTDPVWIYGNSSADLMKTIVNGTESGMPGHRYTLTPEEIGNLIAYLQSIQPK